MDLRKGKEQVGWWSLTSFIIYESLQYYTSHCYEHDTEKYRVREFPGVPVCRKKSRKLGSGARALGCIP